METKPIVLQKNGKKLYAAALAAFFLGILFGILTPGIFPKIAFLGEIYVRLLKLLVVPIMMAQIITGVSGAGDAFSRRLLRTVLYNPGSMFGVGGNNHHCMFEFRGKTYIAYHAAVVDKELKWNAGYRSTLIDELKMENGLPALTRGTLKGVEQVAPVNPYTRREAAEYASEAAIDLSFKNGAAAVSAKKRAASSSWRAWTSVRARRNSSSKPKARAKSRSTRTARSWEEATASPRMCRAKSSSSSSYSKPRAFRFSAGKRNKYGKPAAESSAAGFSMP